MGCDIHSHVEILKDGKWVNASLYVKGDKELERVDPVRDRWYALFAQMAGVRLYTGDIQPVSLPRGLPSDVSEETKKDSKEWGEDGHSHSYLFLEEMQKYTNNLPPERRTMEVLINTMLLCANAYWVFDPSKIRLVFWFDN